METAAGAQVSAVGAEEEKAVAEAGGADAGAGPGRRVLSAFPEILLLDDVIGLHRCRRSVVRR